MSKTVDERVVEMRFDNAQFEKNVKTSMSTIDRLKQSLNFKGATDSFNNITKASNNVSFDKMAAGIEALQNRFSTFGIIGMRILENLTDAAVSFVTNGINKITSSIINGGINRAFNIENAHFQLQGLLKDETKVQAVMQDAMDSVTDTAYGYDEAAKAASQFAASGMQAGAEMQAALRAIAGTAAMTNSSYEDISRIYTTVSGNGRLMGEQLLQLSSRGLNAAATIAEYFNGVNNGSIVASDSVKAAVKSISGGLTVAEGNIREFITDGKISFDIFSAAMDNAFGEHAKKANETFSGALSNVKAALSRIGAEFVSPLIEQNGALVKMLNVVKERINDVKKNIGPIASAFTSRVIDIADRIRGFLEDLDVSPFFNKLNGIIEKWDELGGRAIVFESLGNIFRGLAQILGTVKNAFAEVIPGTTVKRVVEFVSGIKNATAQFKLSDKTAQDLKNTFKGIFAIVDILSRAFVTVAGGVLKAGTSFSPLIKLVVAFTGKIGETLVQFDAFTKKSGAFEYIVSAISKAFSVLVGVVTTVVSKIGEYFAFPAWELFHAFLERIHERLTQLGGAFDTVKAKLDSAGDALAKSSFVALLQAIWNMVKVLGGAIGSMFTELGRSLVDKLANADFSGIVDLLNLLATNGIAVGVLTFVQSFKRSVGFLTTWASSIKVVLNNVKLCLMQYQKELKAKMLINIASAIAILAAALFVLAMIDSDKLASSVAAMGGLFAELVGSMALFEKIGGSTAGIMKSTTAMIKMAIAIQLLATALIKLSALSWTALATGLAGIAGLATICIATAKLLSKNKKMMKGVSGLILFAYAIKLLSKSVIDLATLNWEELAKGLTGVGALLAGIALFLNMAKFSGKAIVTAAGILILAIAMERLVPVCKSFAQLKWEDISKGLASIAGILGVVAGFTRLSGSSKHILSTSVSLLIIAKSMGAFADIIAQMTKLSWEEIAKGLTVIGVSLLAIAIATNLMPNGATMLAIGAGLLLVSTALSNISKVLEHFGGLSWELIGKELGSLGILLGEFAIALHLMKGTLSGSAALLVAAVALNVLAPALSLLGAMSWNSIIKGLTELAGAFIIMGIAGKALKGVVGPILSLAASFALIGAGSVLLGAGLIAIGAGLTSIGAGLTALAGSIVANATSIVAATTILIAGFANLVPLLAKKIAEAIGAFCDGIISRTDSIGNALKVLILKAVEVLVDCIPVITDGALKMLVGVLAALVKYTPSIVDKIFTFIIELINGVAEKLPDLIQAVFSLVKAFFSGIVGAIENIDSGSLIDTIKDFGIVTGLVAALAAVAALIPTAMVGVLGVGAVITEISLVLAAIGALAQIPGLDWFIKQGGNFLQTIGTAIGQFIGGLVGGALGGVSTSFPAIATNLSTFMTNLMPFIVGAKMIDSSVLENVKSLAMIMLILTAEDILNSITSWFTGGSSLSDFAAQLVPFGQSMVEFSSVVSGNIDTEAVTAAANAGKILAEMAATVPNSGGLVSYFTGENNLSDFTAQLVPFGEAIAEFSSVVSGNIDADAVSAAASAGKMMTDMAETIPNSGGLVSFFTGDNDMAEFGDQLVPFGEAMVKFASAVKNLNAEVVEKAAIAGKAVASMGTDIPNSGGLISFFTGDNDMAEFGNQLVPFGEALVKFGNAVSGVDAGSVNSASTAGKNLASMATSINDNYTSGIEYFSNSDLDLETFKLNIINLGRAIKGFVVQVSGVDGGLLSSAIAQGNDLADMASKMSTTGADGLNDFSRALSNFGTESVDRFINAMRSSTGSISAAASSMIAAYNSGIKVGQLSTVAIFNDMMMLVIKTLNNYTTRFTLVGQTLITRFIAGMKSKDSAAGSAVSSMVSSCVTTITNKYGSFESAGKYLIDGFAKGITDNTYVAVNATSSFVNAVKNKVNKALDEHSPSKWAYRAGQYFDMGLANGIHDYTNLASDSAEDLGKSVKSGMTAAISKVRDALDGKIDEHPTIRPVLDLSDIENKSRTLNTLFSSTQAIRVGASINASTAQNQNGVKSTGNIYNNFTQNNYSPKALSRLDIYRQSRNLLASAKGVMG